MAPSLGTGSNREIPHPGPQEGPFPKCESLSFQILLTRGPPHSLYTGVPSSLAQASGSNIMPILPESPYRAQHRLLVRFCVMKKSCSPAVLSSNVFSEQGRRAVLTCPKRPSSGSFLQWEPWRVKEVGIQPRQVQLCRLRTEQLQRIPSGHGRHRAICFWW